MKPYMLGLGLMLAGEAKAEKQKECVDEIVFGIRFPHFKADEIAQYFNNATEQKKEAFLNDLAEHSREVYTEGFGIDVAFFEYNDDKFMEFYKHKKEHPNTLILYGVYRKTLGRDIGGLAFVGSNVIDFTLHRSTSEWMQRREEEKALLMSRWIYITMDMGAIIAHEIGHFFGLENSPRNVRETEGFNVMGSHPGGWGGMEFSVKDKAKILEQVCEPEGQK